MLISRRPSLSTTKDGCYTFLFDCPLGHAHALSPLLPDRRDVLCALMLAAPASAQTPSGQAAACPALLITVQPAADRQTRVALPIPRQGAVDRQHGELLRVHAPVRRIGGDVPASTSTADWSCWAFPANDFGAQEPGSNKEIAEFCRLTYGVQFPMFEKTSVKSLETNPLYSELLARPVSHRKWNFYKYLIDRSGKPAGTFASQVEPDDRALLRTARKAARRQGRFVTVPVRTATRIVWDASF